MISFVESQVPLMDNFVLIRLEKLELILLYWQDSRNISLIVSKILIAA